MKSFYYPEARLIFFIIWSHGTLRSPKPTCANLSLSLNHKIFNFYTADIKCFTVRTVVWLHIQAKLVRVFNLDMIFIHKSYFIFQTFFRSYLQ